MFLRKTFNIQKYTIFLYCICVDIEFNLLYDRVMIEHVYFIWLCTY